MHACRGPKIGEGFVVVTGKRNKPERVIPGWWAVRRCDQCLEYFSTPADLIDAKIVPNERVVKQKLFWESTVTNAKR
jgi:hypothetical protein